MRRADGLRARQVDVRALARREYDDLFLRPRNGHVEPPLAAGAVQRAEVHHELSVGALGVADREEYDVAFVALHVFEVLDEERLVRLVSEVVLELRVGGAALVYDVLY